MKFTKLIIATIPVVAIFIMTAAIIGYYFEDQKVQADEKRRMESYGQILEGVSSHPIDYVYNLATPVADGSYLVFGGSQNPKPYHQDAWDKIKDIHMTSIRTDFSLENMLPKNITLEDYKNNVDGIQDPEKWEKSFVKYRYDIFKSAKDRGLKTFGIVAYAPPWLTYSGNEYGVPKDWDVYEDVVKKSYRLYRDQLDFLELWNEPTYTRFLDPTGSPYTREEAYHQIFLHAAKAVREVDNEKNDGKQIPLGAQIAHTPTHIAVLDTILQDEAVRSQINFISYHNYEHVPEPSDTAIKEVMQKHGVNYPIYVNEWNIDPSEDKPDPRKNTDAAILYTSSKLLDYLIMGVAGANYYSVHPYNDTMNGLKEGTLGFYRWQNDRAELLPQAKSWTLLSKQMGLGTGSSKIFVPEKKYMNLKSIAFTNSLGQDGIIVVNTDTTGHMVDFHLQNFDKGKYMQAKVYFASGKNDAKSPVNESLLKSKDQSLRFVYFVPAGTVMGVVFTEDKKWFTFPFN